MVCILHLDAHALGPTFLQYLTLCREDPFNNLSCLYKKYFQEHYNTFCSRFPIFANFNLLNLISDIEVLFPRKGVVFLNIECWYVMGK